VYSDQHSIFFTTKKVLSIEEQLSARAEPTQFGRLLEELGIRLIRARSPQAKGRVERLWGTFQDRLSSELRLAGAATREEANVVLQRYLPRHNRRFSVPPADPVSAYVPWPRQRQHHEVFCFKFRRVVGNDNTVHLGKLLIDIPPCRERISYAHLRVEVHQRFDGTVHVFHDGVHLASARYEPSDPDNLRLGAIGTGHAVSPVPPAAKPLAAPPPLHWDPHEHPWRKFASVASRSKSLNR
jgi:hypothetical protein